MRTLLLITILAGLAVDTANAAGLAVDGRFLRDYAGHVVFFHGVNAVWKRPPYYPPSSIYPGSVTEPAGSYFDERSERDHRREWRRSRHGRDHAEIAAR